MVSRNLTVKNKQGFHLRPANEFATAMSAFSSEVTLVYGEKEVNGKSLMNIVAAGIRGGGKLEVRCDGADENEALAEAERLINSGFGEEMYA